MMNHFHTMTCLLVAVFVSLIVIPISGKVIPTSDESDLTRCYCNLPSCYRDNYMCYSHVGCFEELPDKSIRRTLTSDSGRRFGCRELWPGPIFSDVKETFKCFWKKPFMKRRRASHWRSQRRRQQVPPVAVKSFILEPTSLYCCNSTMCNYETRNEPIFSNDGQKVYQIDNIDALLFDKPATTQTGVTESKPEGQMIGLMDLRWFRGLLIAIVFGGGIIITLLCCVAVCIFKAQIRSAQALPDDQMSMDRSVGSIHACGRHSDLVAQSLRDSFSLSTYSSNSSLYHFYQRLKDPSKTKPSPSRGNLIHPNHAPRAYHSDPHNNSLNV